MIKKFVAIVLFALVFCTIAGCVNFPSNPLASSNPNHSATFARSIESIGWAPINTISKLSDNVYSGSYKNSSLTFEITIEIAQSEAAAKERYGQSVLKKLATFPITWSKDGARELFDE
jgi:hypothetical protein